MSMDAWAALMMDRLRRWLCVKSWGLAGAGDLGLGPVVNPSLSAVRWVGVSRLDRKGTPCWPGRVAAWLMIAATVGVEGLTGGSCAGRLR